MPDELETFVSRHWEDFASGVASGLKDAADHRLESLLHVTTSSSTTPYRVSAAWPPEPDGRTTFRQVTAHVTQWAYRFRATWTIGVEAQRPGNPAEARQAAQKFAAEAALAETQSVLDLLVPASAGPLDSSAVKRAATRFDGRCRLLVRRAAKGATSDPVTFEQVVVPDEAMPSRIDALLVATRDGPAVERLGDDLALTWARTGKRTAELALTSDVLLRHGRRASSFRLPSTP